MEQAFVMLNYWIVLIDTIQSKFNYTLAIGEDMLQPA